MQNTNNGSGSAELFLDILESRRSCRSYTNKQIDENQLTRILQAGTYAPSAMGAQDASIVAVQDPGILESLRRLNAQVRGVENDPYYGAPTIVLVFASSNNPNAIQDGSCILENMMLAAHALGLGSCWINREIEMFETEEGKELMKKMNLPENWKGIGAISLGYRNAAPSPRKPRKENYFRIIR